MKDEAGSDAKGEFLFAASMTALFVAIGCVGVLRHEMWRDEVQAWMIAQSSATPADLLRNVRLETHPELWHWTLWILTRITRSLRAFQFTHLALASLGVFLLCRNAPLSRWEKILLSFGYFTLFEYGLVARNYVMGVVLVYAFCAAYAKRRFALGGALLFLLTQTSLHGLIIACGLALFLAAEPASAFEKRRIHAALALTAFGVLLSGIEVSAAYEANRQRPGALDPAHLADVLQGIGRSFFPIPDLASRPLWGSNLLQGLIARSGLGETGAVWTGAGISLATGALAAAVLRKRMRALLFFAGTSGALLAFGFAVFQGAIRHSGHLFLTFVAALWLARSGGRDAPARALRWFVPAIFAAQAAGGLIAWGLDLALPFSRASETAHFIRQERLDALPLFGDRAPPASSLQPYLDRPITYLADGKRGGFILWGPPMKPKAPDPGRMWSNLLRETLDSPAREALLILNYPVDRAPSRYRIREIKRFTGSLAGDEDYFLYRVSWDGGGGG